MEASPKTVEDFIQNPVIILRTEPTIATRRVAILIADGYDSVACGAVKAALLAAKALPFTIGPGRNPLFAAGEDRKTKKGLKPDHPSKECDR